MITFADKVIKFNKSLQFNEKLPEGIRIMNPFREDPQALEISSKFYKKFYDDGNQRFIILGINPGRFGGGLTGIPFTDPKRLKEKCGIDYQGNMAHETSSVYIYDMIDAFGGPQKFYKKFYINAICPLGFTSQKENGKEVNYNYYDSKELTAAVYDFMVDSLKKQISFGINTNVCFCLGTGKNEKFIKELNNKLGFFKEIIPLEHPRFIMQYKLKTKQNYINKYLSAFERYL